MWIINPNKPDKDTYFTYINCSLKKDIVTTGLKMKSLESICRNLKALVNVRTCSDLSYLRQYGGWGSVKLNSE